MRIEQDFLGKVTISQSSLFGINSVRARENFPLPSTFAQSWYSALGFVKKACYITYNNYKIALLDKHPNNIITNKLFSNEIINSLIYSSNEIANGKHFEHFIVPGNCGGAGTSINMNINEIIANNSIKILGGNYGDYFLIDPIEHANIFQSTNDVVPTALHLAAMNQLDLLEESINKIKFAFEEKERKFASTFRFAYTQMQEAVPSTYGKLFGGYAEALSRDWWRISKCKERIKVVNLGGGAAGTGIAVPKYFILNAINTLNIITNKTFARAEHLPDATSNQDSLVEVHGILKSLAVNLIKISSDLRLLGSDLCCKKISIPKRQIGSSIMPSKVNPVIIEYIHSLCYSVLANDQLISQLCSAGCLDLNAYLPIIGDNLLKSISYLQTSCESMTKFLVNDLNVNKNISTEEMLQSPIVTTVLNPIIGYNSSSQLAYYMIEHDCSIIEANQNLQLTSQNLLKKITEKENLVKMGYRVDDFEN